MEYIKKSKCYHVDDCHTLVIEQYVCSVYNMLMWRYRIINNERPQQYPSFFGTTLTSRPNAKRIIGQYFKAFAN